MTGLPALDPARVFPTYVGNAELSPFHHCYANEQTVLRLAAGRFFAHHNGDDPVTGYWALRKRAALYDVPERPVEISGPDAVPFLERIFVRRVRDRLCEIRSPGGLARKDAGLAIGETWRSCVRDRRLALL